MSKHSSNATGRNRATVRRNSGHNHPIIMPEDGFSSDSGSDGEGPRRPKPFFNTAFAMRGWHLLIRDAPGSTQMASIGVPVPDWWARPTDDVGYSESGVPNGMDTFLSEFLNLVMLIYILDKRLNPTT